MKLAAAPRRVARTWSVISLGVLAVADIAMVFVHTLTDAFKLEVSWVLVVNAGAALVIAIFRFLAQPIEVSREEKIALLKAVANEPMLPVEHDVVVRVGNEKIN